MKKIACSWNASGPSWISCCCYALTCALCALALASCTTGTKATKAPPPPPPPPPSLQANLRAPCPALPLASSDAFPALLANHDAVAAQYHDCKDSQGSLLLALDEWEATAWRWYCNAVAAAGLDASACRKHEASRSAQGHDPPAR